MENLSIKKHFKVIWQILWKHKFTFFSIAIILQFVFLNLGTLLLKGIFSLALKTAGLKTLTQHNVLELLSHPVSVILLLGLAFLVAFLMLLEFSTLLFVVEYQVQDYAFSFKKAMERALGRIKQFKIYEVILFVGYFILFIPVANVGLSSSLLNPLYVPKFITGELMKTSQGVFLLVVLLILLTYLQLRFIFVFPLMIYDKGTFFNELKQSWHMTKKGKLRFLFLSGIFSGIFALFDFLTLGILLPLFSLIDPSGNNFWLQTVFYTFLGGSFFLFGVLLKLSIVAMLFYVLKEQGFIPELAVNHYQRKHRRPLFSFLTLVVLLFGSFFYYSSKLYTNTVNDKVAIIAHRGVVAKGVENSLEALKAAAEAGADYVELDVVLTKDQKLVVIHDNDLKRLAGVNKKVRELTEKEVLEIPISQNGFHSHIPSFEAYVTTAKKLGVKLLVEIKPYGNEPKDFSNIIIEKAQELGILEESLFMSLDKELMLQLKQQAPKLKAGLVIPLQIGPYPKGPLDFYVIEDFSYSYYQAEKAQEQGKDIFVWTINDEQDIYHYLQTSVNGIITDEVKEVKDIQEEMLTETSYFDKMLRLISFD